MGFLEFELILILDCEQIITCQETLIIFFL